MSVPAPQQPGATMDTSLRDSRAAALDNVRNMCNDLAEGTCRKGMLGLLQKVEQRFQREQTDGQRGLGRRPGGLPDRRDHLNQLSDTHPEKLVRTKVYTAMDVLLDLVWPVRHENGTVRARRSRGGVSRDELVATRKAAHDAAFEAELAADAAAFQARMQAEEAALRAELQAERAASQAVLAAAPPPPPPLPPKHWRAHPRAMSVAVDATVRACPKKVKLQLEVITQCACCGGAITKKSGWGIGRPLYPKDHKTYLCRTCTPGRWKNKQGHPRFSYTYRFRPVSGCTCDGEYVPQSDSCASDDSD